MPDTTLMVGSAPQDQSRFAHVRPNLRTRLHLLLSAKGFLALCDQGVISLGNFLTGLALGRLVGKNELGLYALCWTIVCITVDLSGALTTTPYTVFSPRMRESERSRYVGNIFLLHCAISLCVGVFIIIGGLIAITERAPTGLLRSLATVAAVLVLLNAREFMRRICFADMAVGLALILDIIFTTFHLAGLLLLWREGELTASAVYVLLGVVGLGQTTIWLLIYRARIRLTWDWWSEGPRHWHFAKWVLGSAVVWMVATYLYPWLLAAYHGTMSTGVWASCSAVVAVGNPVLGGLINYLGPKLSTLYASSGLGSMKRYVYRSSILLVLLLSPFALVLSLWGGPIMTALYGPAYAGTHVILVLLSLNLLALSFSHPYARGLFTLQAARADMFVNLVAVTILFIIGVMAVKSYSVTGAAAALLLSTFVTAVMRVAIFARTAAGSPYRPETPEQRKILVTAGL